MKITKVILVCDAHPLYYPFAKDVYDLWEKRLGITPQLYIISNDKLPINFENRNVKYITPIQEIPTKFQAQVIRLLLPSLFPNDYVIISDIDMLPISKKYFGKVLKYIPDDIFLQYFYNNQICYNLAKGSLWKEIFEVDSLNTIIGKLKEWYYEYNGAHTTDQQVLGKYLEKYDNKRFMLGNYLPEKTMIRRLSLYSKTHLVKKIVLEDLTKYLDFHAHGIFEDEENLPYYKNIVKHLLGTKKMGMSS